MSDVTQDMLFTQLDKKQDEMLPPKNGLYSNGEGEDGDSCVCMHNGTYFFGVKMNGNWKYISMIDSKRLSNENDVDSTMKDNFSKYLDRFKNEILDLIAGSMRLGSWAVHHSFTSDFIAGGVYTNWIQFSANDTNEPNSEGNRLFIVPIVCVLKRINFYMVFPSENAGSDVTYQFDVKIEKGDISSSLATVKTETLTVTVLAGNLTGFGMIYPNIAMIESEFYQISIRQSSASLNATKISKAVSFFQAT